MRQGVVLLSGGLDSTTVAALARRQGFDLVALTADYGQTHRVEVQAAARVAERLAIPHRVLDVGFFAALAWRSALTQPRRYATPLDRSAPHMADSIPDTYVPLRNSFLVVLAAALLESRALAAIEEDGVPAAELSATILIAANAVDYSGYPDCRPEYFAEMERALGLGSKLTTEHGVPIRIETPLIGMSKAQIVRLSVEQSAPLADTWSCYGPGPKPCGRCDSCILRAKGFAEAGVVDPALEGL